MENNKIKEEYDNWLKLFLEHYALEGWKYFKAKESIYYGPLENKICRFCNNTNQNEFKNRAHLISKFLGNIHFFSNYECDKCNKLFDEYEKSLANYIGLLRYFEINENYHQRRRIKFKDRESGAKVYLSKKGMIIDDPENKISHYDEKSKKIVFDLIKKPYTPIHIYKILLKIFISLLSESSTNFFNKILKFITTTELDSDPIFLKYSCLVSYRLDSSKFLSDYPVVYTYKNIKKLNNSTPIIIFVICFKNLIYQIYALSDFDYENLASTQNGDDELLVYPPVIYDSTTEYDFHYVNYIIENLSSKDKVFDMKDEFAFDSLVDSVILEYDEEEWKKNKNDFYEDF